MKTKQYNIGLSLSLPSGLGSFGLVVTLGLGDKNGQKESEKHQSSNYFHQSNKNGKKKKNSEKTPPKSACICVNSEKKKKISILEIEFEYSCVLVYFNQTTLNALKDYLT